MTAVVGMKTKKLKKDVRKDSIRFKKSLRIKYWPLEMFAHMFPIWMFFKTIRTWLNSNRHMYRSRHIAFKAIWGTAKCTATLAVHFKKHQIYRKIRFRHADHAKKTSNSIVQLLKELCLDFNEFFSQNQIFSEMDVWFKFLTLCNLPCLKTEFIFDYS